MKTKHLLIAFVLLLCGQSHAQSGRTLHGIVRDTSRQTIPGSAVTLASELNESMRTSTDTDGRFVFRQVKGSKIDLTVAAIGYQTLKWRYNFPPGNSNIDLENITIKPEKPMFKDISMTGVKSITYKEDTIMFNVGAYKTKGNGKLIDLLKKLPGLDVYADESMAFQGKVIKKISINEKEYTNGKLKKAMENMNADKVKSVLLIDDYSNTAAITSIKTGEPDKIMNIILK